MTHAWQPPDAPRGEGGGSARAARRARRALAFAVAGALGACAVGPDYRAPEPRLPQSFLPVAAVTHERAERGSMPGKEPDRGAAPAAEAADPAQWWHAFGDAQLDALVVRALRDNPGLQVALARLEQARSFEVAIAGTALPGVEVAAGGGRGTGSNLARGGRVPGDLHAADTTNTSGIQHVSQEGGLDAIWDIDLSGRFRRAIEAARYDAQAAAAARDGVEVALIADVVRAYIDLRGYQTQVAVLQQSVGAAQGLYDLVEARFERGITNELDVTLARRQLASVQADLAARGAQVEAARNALAVLLGQFPENLQEELTKPALIPAIPAVVQTGQPIALLRRRPDVREAEWELAGATARIGVAVGNLFPQLSLGAAVGRESDGLGLRPHASQSIWSLGYALSLPLLDFGTLDALVTVADLQAREQLLHYRQTVLAAFEEVDSAAANFAAQQERLRRLGEAVIAAQRATQLASERYERGLTDFLNVVDAERQEYELEAQYAVAQTTVGEQYVALYRALGGGWEQFAGPPPALIPEPAVVAMFRRLVDPAPRMKDAAAQTP